MASAAVQRLTPGSAEEAAELLRDAADGVGGGREVGGVGGAGEVRGAVRIRGGATKLGWGRPVDAGVELSSERLDAIVAHNAGDLTAVLAAGVPLAAAQAVFAEAGQMLALDPPLAADGASGAAPRGADGGATVGGVIATGDSGPLRHRYGAPRDLVLGVQLALPDGSVARAGSQVIKNVAGYDLAKLCSGAFGTLGLLTEVTVRLHPRPAGWCSAVGRSDDPHALAAAASALAHRPLEAEALDLRWEDGAGAVLARFGGSSAGDRAAAALRELHEAGLDGAAIEDDEPLWSAQRDAQRGSVVLRVSTTQDRLGELLAAAQAHGARAVARAAHGLAWVALPAGPLEGGTAGSLDAASAADAGPAAGSLGAASAADAGPAAGSVAAASATDAGATAGSLEAASTADAAALDASSADTAALAATVRSFRAALAPAPCVLLDAPASLRAAVDPWGDVDPARVDLMRRVKERFDPERRCNPGLFVGGI